MTAKKSKNARRKTPQSPKATGTTTAASPELTDPVTPLVTPLPTDGVQNVKEKEVPAVVAESSTSANAEQSIEDRADELKEKGNDAFKSMEYGTAIDRYTEAIVLRPSEPTYLTNRAASYMALKRFRLALADCQTAAALQSGQPSAKTLLRLARCQLATGEAVAALSTLRQVLSLEPNNSAALLVQRKAQELESHMRNYENARKKRDWGMARLALDKCQQTIEGESGDVPSAWRCWRIELELARGNWEAANNAANEALRLDSKSADVMALRGLVLFLSAKLPDALKHALSALRLDPDNVRAKKLRVRVKAVERLKEEGNAFFKQSKWQDAIDRYSEALETVGASVDEGQGGQMRATLLSNRATTLIKLERYDEALEDIDSSLELNSTSFKALRTRARINLYAERYDAAVTDFKQALEQARVEGSTADVKSLQTELRKAEADLKRSKSKDYYKILGIPKTCTESEIKKAYRRESLIHHPDKGGDEEKFKLVVEAHSVLSDPQKRERYDMGVEVDGTMDSSGMGGGFSPFGGGGFAGGGMSGLDPDDFANIFMRFGPGGGSGGGGGYTSFRTGGHGPYGDW